MSAAGIGRLLTATLHQAISELLSTRLSFYEPWLTTDGVRITRVSLAGVRAALSFLRQEPDAYHPVLHRAGELAAVWVWRDLSAVRRAVLRLMPVWVRTRAAVSLARRLAADTWLETDTAVRWRRGEGRLTVHPSLFCEVRGTAPAPLCTYYAASVETFLRELGVAGDVRVDSCQATGGKQCRLVVAYGRIRKSTLAFLGLAAVVACLHVVGAAAQVPGAPLAVRDRVLVVPFANASREARLSWLGEGAALLITEDLRADGIDAMTRDERLRAFDRLQVPPLAALSRATVIRIGQLVGASDVMTGSIAREGEDLVIRARRVRLEPGVLEPEVVERAGAADLMGAFARLSRRLGMTGMPADGAVTGASHDGPPLPAFEAYVKGLLADTPATQTVFLEQALKTYPAYDAARIALWRTWTEAGDHRAAIAAIRPLADAARPSVEAQFLLSRSLLHLGQTGESLAVLTALHARAPSAEMLNNMGVAVLRDPTLAASGARAAWYFGQARTMDGLDPDYLFNLGYAYWRDGDPDGASYWLRECVRLTPSDGAAHALLAQALRASGDHAEAARELALAQRLSSAFDGVNLEAVGKTSAPMGLERPKDVLASLSARRIDAALEMVGQRDQKEVAAFYLERGRRLVDRELDGEAEGELTRALYLAPYHAEVHLLLGRVYLRSGRLREAIDAAKISLWSEESAGAHLVLAEAYLESRDFAAARAEADRAFVLDPKSTQAHTLLDRLPKTP